MERSAWPKNLSSSRKHAIKELLHGQNPRDLFDAHSETGNNTGQPLFAEDLFVNVLRSFSNTLSESMSVDSDEVLQVPTNACLMSEVSEESESINTPDPRKTSYTWTIPDLNLIDYGHQRRIDDQQLILNPELPKKTSVLWTEVSLDLEVGYQWRNCGQRPILNSEFPGNHFRCAHEIDQGCQATKLIEKIKDDPPAYRTIYQGHHTCKEPDPQNPPLIQDSTSSRDSTIPLSFNINLIAQQDDDDNNPVFFDFLSVNHEPKLPSEDYLNPRGHSHDDNNNNNQFTSSDHYAVWERDWNDLWERDDLCERDWKDLRRMGKDLCEPDWKDLMRRTYASLIGRTY